jgi:hypothetical protein
LLFQLDKGTEAAFRAVNRHLGIGPLITQLQRVVRLEISRYTRFGKYGAVISDLHKLCHHLSPCKDSRSRLARLSIRFLGDDWLRTKRRRRIREK